MIDDKEISDFARGEVVGAKRLTEVARQLNEVSRDLNSRSLSFDDGSSRAQVAVMRIGPNMTIVGANAAFVMGTIANNSPATQIRNGDFGPDAGDGEAWELPKDLSLGFFLGTRVVNVTGGPFYRPVYASIRPGIQKIRYDPQTGKLQLSYLRNPTTNAHWEDIVTFVDCPPSSSLRSGGGNLFNPFGIGGDESIFRETISVNLGQPLTGSAQLTAAATAIDGTGATTLMTFGTTGGTLFHIRFIGIASTTENEIRIFHAVNGGTKRLLDTVRVEPAVVVGGAIGKRWKGTWRAEDPVNGLPMGPNDVISIAQYETGTIDAIGIGANL